MSGTTVAEALRDAANRLSDTSDTARLDAEVLMAHALGVDRSELLLHRQRDPVPPEFARLIERRLRHEPVAYIVGHQEFMGHDFLVTPEVLIPRADSETLVERALSLPAPNRVLDLGTGSGALLLSVLAERPRAEAIGIDRSLGALAVAAANAARLGLSGNARFLARDWREAAWMEGLGEFDLILANPPYVATEAELAQSVSGHEPAGALFAGPQGMDDYCIIVPQLADLLTPKGVALVEFGIGQAKSLASLAQESGFACQIHRDLGGRERVAELRKSVN